MEKVFVRFTEEEEDEKREILTVYEAIIEGDKVQILMPKASHPAARDFSKSIGFGDTPAYIVEGEFIGTDDNSRSLLKNPQRVHQLFYDSNKEEYLFNEPPTPIDYDSLTTWQAIKLARKELIIGWKELMAEVKSDLKKSRFENRQF